MTQLTLLNGPTRRCARNLSDCWASSLACWTRSRRSSPPSPPLALRFRSALWVQGQGQGPPPAPEDRTRAALCQLLLSLLCRPPVPLLHPSLFTTALVRTRAMRRTRSLHPSRLRGVPRTPLPSSLASCSGHHPAAHLVALPGVRAAFPRPGTRLVRPAAPTRARSGALPWRTPPPRHPQREPRGHGLAAAAATLATSLALALRGLPRAQPPPAGPPLLLASMLRSRRPHRLRPRRRRRPPRQPTRGVLLSSARTRSEAAARLARRA